MEIQNKIMPADNDNIVEVIGIWMSTCDLD